MEQQLLLLIKKYNLVCFSPQNSPSYLPSTYNDDMEDMAAMAINIPRVIIPRYAKVFRFGATFSKINLSWVQKFIPVFHHIGNTSGLLCDMAVKHDGKSAKYKQMEISLKKLFGLL